MWKWSDGSDVQPQGWMMLDENTNINVPREDFFQLQICAPYDNDEADRLPDSARCQYRG